MSILRASASRYARFFPPREFPMNQVRPDSLRELLLGVLYAFLDYDDTLGQTEYAALGAAYGLTDEMFQAECGVTLTHSVDDHRRRFPGQTYTEIAHTLMKELGCSIDAKHLQRWADREVDRVCEEFSRSLEPTVGSINLLQRLAARNIERAVVSSSALRRLRVCLEATSQCDYVDPVRVFSAIDSLQTPQSKPDPAVFSHALAACNVAPEQVFVIEDSGSGVLSARGAGIERVIGYTGALTPEKRAQRGEVLSKAGAVIVIDSLDMVTKALG